MRGLPLFVGGAILIGIGALGAGLIPGCTAQQAQQSQEDLTQAQSYLSATTQATAEAQQAKAAIDQVLASATAASASAGATTQPTVTAALTTLQKADADAQAGITQAQAAESAAQTLLTAAQSTVTAINTNTVPNVSGLSVFGTYGELAALAITTGFSIYSFSKNSGLLAQLEQHKDALATVASTTNPVAAKAVALTTPTPAKAATA